MSATKPDNPFSATTYYGAEYFCDRKDETQRLISNIVNGNSTTIMAIRRMGKTGLIQHTITQLPKNCKGVYIDILNTENLNEFLNLLATSLINAIPEKTGFSSIFWEYIKSLRPLISFDNLTGMPQVGFEIKPKEVEMNIDAIFKFLNKQEFRTIIAIDEFQQILNYSQKNTDAWLRTRIQQLQNVSFIFSGSQQHLMSELFTSPKRPFYRSTQIMKLDKIDASQYANFIIDMFKNYHKTIDLEVANEILDWTHCHTFYVQQLCNRVFAATAKKATTEIWKQQAYLLLKEQETVFFGFRNMLTLPQWHLLKGIAAEGVVYQPTSIAFLTKYQLGTSATVLRSLKTLQNYELVYKEFDEKGTSYYSVYDVYFKQWVRG